MEPINKIAETSGFFQAGPQTYYVNSSEIMTLDQFLKIDHNYILFNFTLEDGLKAYYVKLIRVRFVKTGVHLHLLDIQKPCHYSLYIPFQSGSPESTFFLMDTESFILNINVHFFDRRNEIIEKISSVEPFAGWDKINNIIWEEASSVMYSK